MQPEQPGSLNELLPWAAAHFPGRGVGVYDRRGRELERRTYPELDARVRDRARRLARLGIEPGAHVVLCLDTSWELIESWFAVLALGAQPITTAPPGTLGAGETHLDRLEGVLERLDARHLIAVHTLAVEAERAGRTGLVEALLDEERIAAAAPLDDGRELRAAEPDDIAFLQLTSGSTGFPRGVQITHRAALHNTQAIVTVVSEALGAPFVERTRSLVSWLPLHHDMGLVGCLLSGMTAGIDIVLLPPRLFLARPERWIQALAELGPCASSAPNFGYQTVVENRVRELEGGLSGWHTALVGAEMVRPETMNAFEAAYAPLGFSGTALKPCYGLAEATLAVTLDQRGAGVRMRKAPGETGPGAGREVACLGSAVPDTEVEIVAPDGSRVPESSIGAVRVRGPGVFAGYYGDADATADALRDGWLHTGDLGFQHAGELYLTGRTKDVLILRGHNLMPHELEWCAEAEADAGGACRAGAFSIDAGKDGEVAVIVVEVARPEPAALAALDRAIRVSVGRAVGVTLADVAFVRRGRIPKTTSGKVRRGELREQYLAGRIERIDVAVGAGRSRRGRA